MAFVHGKDTVVKVNAVNISAFTNNTDFTDETDIHEVTCYGASRKAKRAGLGDGKIVISGIHDDGAAAPRSVLKPLKNAGTIVPFIFQPAGTGSGRAQSSVSVVIKSYVDTNPVAGMVAWKAELEMSGALDETVQP